MEYSAINKENDGRNEPPIAFTIMLSRDYEAVGSAWT